MKFRYKVLIINIVLLSVSLGVTGYLMIRKNFEITLNSGINHGIEENNLVQSSVEYYLLQVLNGEEYQNQVKEENGQVYLQKQLQQIGSQMQSGVLAEASSFYIRFGTTYAYSSDDKEEQIRTKLFEKVKVGEKAYILQKESGKNYIYVTSCSLVENENLYVINKCDISGNYEILETQPRYFGAIIVGVLVIASLCLYGTTYYLTKPLEKLTRTSGDIARGNYAGRVEIASQDEVGELAEKFNCMAEAVEEHVYQLEDMIERREQFVADFTHEIKTPMTTIIGYADMMRSMELSRQEEIIALNYIFSEGKRLEIMSRKLFDLIYLKNTEIECGAVSVRKLVQEVEQIVRPLLNQKEITLVLDVEDSTIYANKDLFVTVLINLIDNARKASAQGTEIQMIGRKIVNERRKRYEIAVIDQGIGMNEEELKKICDEFYMADKSRARKEGGAGLGMSLVSLILERHGAEWKIESKQDEGTTVCIRMKEL